MSPNLPPKASASEQDLPSPRFQDRWFEYPVRVQPHHTDYAGVVWHGAYLTWLETARVECLGAVGLRFADLVAGGFDLPVVDLQIRYHRALPMGAVAVVKTRIIETDKVRICWEYKIQAPVKQTLYVTACITLVAVNREQAKIMRKLPTDLQNALMQLRSSFDPS